MPLNRNTPFPRIPNPQTVNTEPLNAYTILIPSRARPEQAAHTLSLLPGSLVFIDEREIDAYAAVIPRERIILHPPARGSAEVRRMAIQWSPTHWLVMVDDDLKHVISFCGRRPRRIEDPASIGQLIENMVQACSDLDLRAFCWTRNPHPMNYRAHDPLHFTVPTAGAFGIASKDMLPDNRLVAYEDVDLSMQCLLKYRVILCDNRFHWVFGRCWVGKGGNQGIRTNASDEADRALLRRRWGRHLELGSTNGTGTSKKKNIFGMAIRVDRRSTVASSK